MHTCEVRLQRKTARPGKEIIGSKFNTLTNKPFCQTTKTLFMKFNMHMVSKYINYPHC